jgi:hypothetical protein
MKKVKDLKTLEKFSHLYRDYKILLFEDLNANLEDFKKDFETNQNLILSSLKYLNEISEKEFNDTTPTTQITFQVVTEGFVADKRFIEVQLNLKRWQEIAKLTDMSPLLQKMLRILTGFNL